MASGAGPPAAATVLDAAARFVSDDETITVCAPALRKIDRDLAADAAAAAGDHHDFSLELAWHHSLPAFLFELLTPRQIASAFSSCTTFFNVPISGTCISNTSPALSHLRSSSFWLSLVGVPVAMISPGLSVMNVDT